MTLTSPDTNTQNTYTAGAGLSLSSFDFSADIDITAASSATNNLSTDPGKYYAVQLDNNATAADRKMVVNVPWSSGGTYNWKLNSQTSGSTQTIASGDTVDFKGAGGITVSRSTASNVTTTLFTGTTYSVMGAGNSYAAGLVTAGSATHNMKFLRRDGSWDTPTNTTYSDFVSSTGSAPGTAGLVPAPAAATQGGTYYLNGNKTFSVPAGTYSLPLAASGTRGGVQIGYTESGKNYPVELSSEKMFVNVPWTDTITNTTYSIDVPAATTNINLKGANPTSNDAIALTPSTGISIIRNSDSQLTFSQAASINVTVASSSGSNKYFLDGVLQADAIIKPNFVYRFDQSSATNSSHPLRFSSDSANATPYTTGVTAVGTPGSAGAYTQIITTQATPYLYYYCTSHSGMGGAVPLQVNKITSGQGITVGPSTGDGNVTLSVARATNGANGGLRIGYTAIGTRDYALLLDSNGEGYVNVPWTDSGDTGITGVTLATGTSTGAPLTESIASRELTLTSMVYAGAANVGYVPPGGTATTFLRGDATWQVPPTGPNDNYYVDGASYATGTLTLTRTGSLGSLTATGFLQVGTAATDAMAGNTTTISTAQADEITANTAKVGITTTQAANIVTNNAKVTDTGVPAILSNGTSPTLNTGITDGEVRTLIGAGTGDGDVTGSGTQYKIPVWTSGTAVGDGNITNVSTGEIGIGNSNPEDYNTTSTNNAMLVVGDNSGSQQQNGIAVCADALGVGWLTFRKATGSAISDVRGGLSYSFDSDILGFRTDGEQRMFLYDDGRLSVGVVSSSGKARLLLREALNDPEGGHIRLLNSRTGGTNWYIGVGDDGSTTSITTPGSLYFNRNGSNVPGVNNTALVMTSSLRVGIGTTSPSGKLHVKDGNVNALVVTNTSCGNVGIKTTSPNASLVVKGNISYTYTNYTNVANTFVNVISMAGYPSGLYQISIMKQTNASSYITAIIKWDSTAVGSSAGSIVNTIASNQVGIGFNGSTTLQAISGLTTGTAMSANLKCLVKYEAACV